MNKSFRFFIKLSFYKFVEHFISIFWKKFYFLSLTSKPKSCYEKIRNCNILRLPSTRLLRDYKNFVTLHAGITVTQELQLETSSAKICFLLFENMKNNFNLVFDKNSAELIGFVDLGDPDVNFPALEKNDRQVTHALVFS